MVKLPRIPPIFKRKPRIKRKGLSLTTLGKIFKIKKYK
jgi:hypothetical protein